MSLVRTFSLWCGKWSLKSPSQWRLYIYHVEMLQQEIWGELHIRSPYVPYSSVFIKSVFIQDSLCCMFPALIRNFITDQRHLFSSKFCQNQYIPNVWKNPKCLIFRKRHQKNQTKPNPSLMLMRSESLFSKCEIGSDILSLKMIHMQQEEGGPV